MSVVHNTSFFTLAVSLEILLFHLATTRSDRKNKNKRTWIWPACWRYPME